MPVSDSPWAPTGFGTNTRCIASIFADEGHQVGYAGCQNPEHNPSWETPWPLGQTERKVSMELLPIMHPGQEKFGEKSFSNWMQGFNPDLVFTHLDIQMFGYMIQAKRPDGVQMPVVGEKGERLTNSQFSRLAKKAFKESQKDQFKLASIIPMDGQPSVPGWYDIIKHVDYPIAMSRYGQAVLADDFNGYKSTYIPHGVDCDFFKPKMVNHPDPDAFIVGCVARNQHRKNIPRLMRSFKIFVERNNLTPDQAKLLLHMDWNDHMGWNINYMASDKVYDIADYLVPATMQNLEGGQHPDDAGMVDIYNLMSVHALPTGGEGFGIPTAESMACGKPNILCNYTTSYELVGAKEPECPPEMLLPHGRDGDDKMIVSDRGILVPYKDLMWDTPIRAAPMRALWDEYAGADALEYYYKNPDKVLEHGKNAREFCKKNYDWKGAVGPMWQKFIKKVKI
tara:strand:- start:2715 stop:4070 length:1356 start_codon:yes stop_codon:yes gene_type:complete